MDNVDELLVNMQHNYVSWSESTTPSRTSWFGPGAASMGYLSQVRTQVCWD
jgi:hypothetical protein